MITQERLHELFSYNPDTGIFTWKVKKGRAEVGSVAGTIREDGYIAIKADGKSYKAHRLVWLYVHGCWPENHIDHMDGDISNNRIYNLRDVDRSTNLQNQRNSPNRNSTGLIGVHKSGKSKFGAVININGQAHRLGTFCDPLDAHRAYLVAKRKYHKGCMI